MHTLLWSMTTTRTGPIWFDDLTPGGLRWITFLGTSRRLSWAVGIGLAADDNMRLQRNCVDLLLGAVTREPCVRGGDEPVSRPLVGTFVDAWPATPSKAGVPPSRSLCNLLVTSQHVGLKTAAGSS